MKGQVLLKAISAGRPRQVRLLLDAGTSLKEVDDCGQTALIRAVLLEQENNREKILKILLRRGELVSRSDVVGRNALIWACIYGRDAVVSLLLQNADTDLDINQTDINGQTALYHAVSSGNAACVKLVVVRLQKYDMSVDIADHHGITPLLQAIRLSHDVCASILVHFGKAKVGLGMSYPRDFINVEKWATQSLRDRERANKRNRLLPVIKEKEFTSSRLSIGSSYGSISSFDSFSSIEPDLSDFQSEFSSDNEIFSSKQIEKYLNSHPGNQFFDSVLTESSSSSLVANPSYDEVDFQSTPYTDSNNNVFSAPKDLHKVYKLAQEQMTTSYRQAAVPPSPDSIRESTQYTLETEVSDVGSTKSSKKGKRDSTGQKWQVLKKNLRLDKVKGTRNYSDTSQSTQRLDSQNSFISEKSKESFTPAKTDFSFPAIVYKASTNLNQGSKKISEKKFSENYSLL